MGNVTAIRRIVTRGEADIENLAVRGGVKYFGCVREFSQSSSSLAGSLLIAHPSLFDPNFRRAVLIIGAHDAEEGAYGLVLNRPTENTVADLLPVAEIGALANLPVFIGGPVQQDRLTFASFRWQGADDIFECKTQLGVEEAGESLGQKQTTVRAFIGYSGWTKGQLEAELEQKAWIVGKPERGMFEAAKNPSLWREIMRGLGPWYRLLADAPDDPSLN